MKINKAKVTNFGSYKDLEFAFNNLGLTLIQGPTGAGKSTVMDLVTWVLFGRTAKNGQVDDVRNWSSQDTTTGVLELTLKNDTIRITRQRGSVKENDLFWEESISGDKIRGKDIKDTQALLNKLLGIDFDSFCISSYFTEFSNSAIFFLAPAKSRRSLFDKIVDLSIPIKLTEKASEDRKKTKSHLLIQDIAHSRQLGKIEQIRHALADTQENLVAFRRKKAEEVLRLTTLSTNFLAEKETKIEYLSLKSYRFQSEKDNAINGLIDKIDGIDEQLSACEGLLEAIEAAQKESKTLTCTRCKQHLPSKKLDSLLEKRAKNNQLVAQRVGYVQRLKEIQDSINPYLESISTITASDNYYLRQLESAKNETNPFVCQVDKLSAQLAVEEKALEDLNSHRTAITTRIADLAQLIDLSSTLRATLLQNEVCSVEARINKILRDHFDGEFSVQFALESSDDLLVNIYKNNVECTYNQLSKGQRQLLKLCFSVSIMGACSNNLGIHNSLLMFDEALDGLDVDFKIKAFSLFSELSKNHESVIVIDHAPELQALFNNSFQVTMRDDCSYIG